MNLKIENLKLDKDIYTFGVDKEIKGSFTLISDGKDYKINSINIKHGVIFYLKDKEHSRNLEDLIIAENIQILGNETQKFEFVVPISYPNVLENNDFSSNSNDIKLKNYIEIIANINLNPFDCKEELFPNIVLDINIDNNSINEYEIEKANNYENNNDYINIGFPWEKIDYIKKDLYEKIKKDHKDFRIREYIRERILTIGIIALLIIFIDMFIWIGGLKIFDHHINQEISQFFSLIMFIFSGISIFITLYFSVIVFIGLLYIKRHTMKILFNNIINKNKENFNLKDIFDSIIINYNGKYNCDFKVYLNCYIRIKVKGDESSIFYEKNIYNILIGYYNGDNLNIENIINTNNFTKNINIKSGFFKNDTNINNRIKYFLNSPELFDTKDEKEIS